MRLLPFVVALLCVVAAVGAGAVKETDKHQAAKKKQVDVKSHSKKAVDDKKPLKKVDVRACEVGGACVFMAFSRFVQTPDDAVVPPSKKPKLVVTRASDEKAKNKPAKNDIVKVAVKPATPVKKRAVELKKKNEVAKKKLVDLKSAAREKTLKQSVDAKKPLKKVDERLREVGAFSSFHRIKSLA